MFRKRRKAINIYIYCWAYYKVCRAYPDNRVGVVCTIDKQQTFAQNCSAQCWTNIGSVGLGYFGPSEAAVAYVEMVYVVKPTVTSEFRLWQRFD